MDWPLTALIVHWPAVLSAGAMVAPPSVNRTAGRPRPPQVHHVIGGGVGDQRGGLGADVGVVQVGCRWIGAIRSARRGRRGHEAE
ncbi:MAG TPA: hypothetical protein VNV66_03085, partial [Pilimelia sp.]|nr:hypothetical protein [Pilimelia sp.]